MAVALMQRGRQAARTAYAPIRVLIEHEGFELAGYLAFTALFSLFPFLIFLAALAGFLGDAEAANAFIDFLFEFTPADVAETLAPAVRNVMESRRGDLMTVGIVVALWTSSAGIEALRVVLDRAYGVRENRSLVVLRLQSIGLVIIASFAFFVASITVIAGPLIWEFIDRLFGLGTNVRLMWIAARYIIGIMTLFGVLLAMHRWLPPRRFPWRDLAPGVVVTLILWVLISSGLSFYLGRLGDWSATYGALGGVVITLMFLYLVAIAFILGAELNAFIWRRRHPQLAEVI